MGLAEATDHKAGQPPPCVLFYCQGSLDLKAFGRFREGLAANGWSMAVVTAAPSVWLAATLSGIPCQLSDWRGAAPTADIDVMHSYEGRRGWTDARKGGRFAASLWLGLERAVERFAPEVVVQWNGGALGGRVVAAFATSKGLRTGYVELGNIDSKLFVDSDGVSAASRVARTPTMIDHHIVDEAQLQNWRRNFAQRSAGGAIVPQTVLVRRVNPLFLINWIGANILRLPTAAPVSLCRKLMELQRAFRCRTPRAVLPTGPYIVLPLQVSTDSSLVLSGWDNDKALRVAADRARGLGLKLVVKPHPAERDGPMLARLERVCREEGHLWTGASIIPLVEQAAEVITINSTVGLLAKILGRPVRVLGESLYGRFSERQAQVFAFRHLIDFDPFGAEPASPQAAARLIQMARRAEEPLQGAA